VSDLGGTFWGLLLGSNATVAFITGMVARKKDAGDQANDFTRNLMDRLEKVEIGHAKCEVETGELRTICTRNDLVIRLVVPELQRVSPYSTALAQARDLLGSAFPVPLDTPADMKAALDKLS